MDEQKSAPKQIELKTFLPYFGALLLYFGIYKQVTFYRHFHFPILDYLDISEIIMLFFGDILNISYFAGIQIIVHIAVVAILKWRKIELTNKYLTGAIIAAFVFLFIFIRQTTHTLHFAEWFYIVWIWALYIAFTLIIYLIFTTKKASIYILSLVFLWFLAERYITNMSLLAVHQLKAKGKYEILGVKLKDGTIIQSKKEGFFIGKAERFVFFFNPGGTTTVYALDDVSVIAHHRSPKSFRH